MVMFGDPFVGNVPKKLSKEELAQALRVDIAGELEAILAYDAHAMSTDDERVKTILYSIRDEERQHVGELIHLMEILDPQEAQFMSKGKQEVDQLLGQKGQQGMSQGQQGMMGQGQQGMMGQGHQGIIAQSQQVTEHGYQPMSEHGLPGEGGHMQEALTQYAAEHDNVPQQYQGQHGQQGQWGQGQQLAQPYPPYPGNLGHKGPHNYDKSR